MKIFFPQKKMSQIKTEKVVHTLGSKKYPLKYRYLTGTPLGSSIVAFHNSQSSVWRTTAACGFQLPKALQLPHIAKTSPGTDGPLTSKVT